MDATPVWHGTHGLKQIALQLWAPDYSVLFETELEYNLLQCGNGGYELPPTTYRARLHGEAAERYDWRQKQRQRDEVAIALHANNMQRWSPSLLARSVAYFNLTSTFMHAEESRQRRLASRPTTMQFLRLMRDCRRALPLAACALPLALCALALAACTLTCCVHTPVTAGRRWSGRWRGM